MKKRFACGLIAASFFLTSCWSSREISDLALTFGVGIDKSDNQYLVTGQVVEPGQVAGQKGPGGLQTIMTNFQGKGDTVYEAMNNMTVQTPRQMYLSHLRILVIGEEIARNGIGEILDVFSRNNELRTDYYLVIAKNQRANDILNVAAKVEKNPSLGLFNSIQLAEELSGKASTMTIYDFVKQMMREGQEAFLTSVNVLGEKDVGGTVKNIESMTPPAILKENGLGVFKKDKLVGWLGTTDTQSVNYLTNKIKKAVLNVPCDGGLIAVDIYDVKSQLKTIEKNNQLVGKVTINMLADVTEIACKIKLSEQASIKKLEKNMNKQLKKQLMSTIQTVQTEHQIDIFGFGHSLYQKNPKKWHKLKDEWDNHFASMEIKIDVNAKIKYRGTVKDTFNSDEGIPKE